MPRPKTLPGSDPSLGSPRTKPTPPHGDPLRPAAAPRPPFGGVESPPPAAEREVPEDPAREEESREEPDPSRSGLGRALGFGLVFGFLLQKGGVAKFDILIGVLLLESFVVLQVMLSAIVVGMIGVVVLRRLGLLEPKIDDTRVGANVIGGLIFGAGFALLAYCPGTNAAALGQGNLDALVGVAGMVLGSYLFALASGFTARTVETWGRLGKLTLPDAAGLSPGVFVAFFAPALVAVLVALEVWTGG